MLVYVKSAKFMLHEAAGCSFILKSGLKHELHRAEGKEAGRQGLQGKEEMDVARAESYESLVIQLDGEAYSAGHGRP